MANPYTMRVRIVGDASSLDQTMEKAGRGAESTGKRIKKALSLNGLSVEAKDLSKSLGGVSISQAVAKSQPGTTVSDRVGAMLNPNGVKPIDLVGADNLAQARRQAEDLSAMLTKLQAKGLGGRTDTRPENDRYWEIRGLYESVSEAIGEYEQALAQEAESQRQAQEAALSHAKTLEQIDAATVSEKVSVGTESLSQRVRSGASNLWQYIRSLSSVKKAGNEAAEGTEKLSRTASSTTRNTNRLSNGLKSLVALPFRALGSGVNWIKNLGSASKGSTRHLTDLVGSIRRIGLVSVGLRIAGAALGRLRSIVSGYISENEALQAQVNGLKNAMSQALAPSIGIVINAMSALMPYVVGVSNAFGQLMALLFGSGWTAVANGAKQAASATGGAAKAQEAYNRQLMGFDELNKLSDINSSGGGGGSGSAETKLPAIEAKTPAWLERFKGSFSELFESDVFKAANIGGKVGMAVQTGLDWIGSEAMRFDWRGASEALMDNFNSFMGSGLGEHLGKTFQIALGGLVDFISGLSFADVGQVIATQFNGAIDAIDWASAGELFARIKIALPQTIVGFIQQADWALVGQSLTSFVQSGCTTVSEWITSTDWVGIGESLKTLIDNVDWPGVTQSLGYLLGNAIGAVFGILWGLIKEPWESFKATVKENAALCGGSMVEGLIYSIGEGVANIGSWLWENLAKPIIDGVKDAFGIHSPSTVFKEIGQNLLLGLTGGISDGLSWVQEKLGNLKEKVFGIADDLKNAFSFQWQMPSLKLPHLSINWESVDNAVAQFFGISSIPHLSVDWYAKGGILSGAQIFGRMGSTLLGGGEVGKEAVLPLERNTGWMDLIAERVVAALGGRDSADVNVTIPVTLDGKVLTEVVAKGLRQRARAYDSPVW